jgi:hypothetical protein
MGIAADISAVGRRGMPRNNIQAAIGAVMVNATTSTDSPQAAGWLKGLE